MQCGYLAAVTSGAGCTCCSPLFLLSQAGQSLSDAAYAGELDKMDTLLASGIDINACDQVTYATNADPVQPLTFVYFCARYSLISRIIRMRLSF